MRYRPSLKKDFLQQLAARQEQTLQRYEDILNSITDALLITDHHFVVQYMNKMAERIFLYPDKIRQHCIWEVEPKYKETLIYPEMLKSLDTQTPVHFEFEGLTTGRWFEADIYPSTEQLVCVFRNITERKRLHAELVRLDRLDLIGQMAAGIGHEIRNPMTTVRGFLQMLQVKPPCLEYQDFFHLMIDELDRANSIITEFLSLARKGTSDLVEQDLNQIIQTILPLLTANALQADKNIQFNSDPLPSLWLNEKEMRQLILNLVRNGLEAMSSGGSLQIQTYVEAGQVVLAVQDQGCGIPAHDLDKLGTPFFTSKPEGTGLGLAICYAIAQRHQATIGVQTGPGGTTFYVQFKESHEHSQ